MNETADNPAAALTKPSPALRVVDRLGNRTLTALHHFGGVNLLLLQTSQWYWRSVILRKVRFGRMAFYSQLVRLGVRSIGVISLVSAAIGIILALQMAPPLTEVGGDPELVANIIAVAMLRELGPVIAAVVLTGFAGAAIAAEIGTMVVGEEIEALEAHALNPIRFLALPRIMATALATLIVTIIGEVVAICAGWWVGVAILDVPTWIYFQNTIDQASMNDFGTGLVKAVVFGVIISGIACYNGLSVTGGAMGVGKATTNTVVYSVVAIIISDLVFTAVFYRLGLT